MRDTTGPPAATNHPIDHLHAEHALIRDVLDATERETRHMLAERQVRPEFWRRVFEFWEHFVDRFHHDKEEGLLFPELERHGCGHEHGPLAALQREHEQSRRSWPALRQLVITGDIEGAARAALHYVDLERRHIEREERMLLPLALELLEDEAVERLRHGFNAHRDVVDPAAFVRCLAIAQHLGRGIGRHGDAEPSSGAAGTPDDGAS